MIDYSRLLKDRLILCLDNFYISELVNDIYDLFSQNC